MADWTGMGVATPRLYRRMAEHELRGVSPSYESICLAVAADAGICALLDELPTPKRQPNLLLGAVRYLDGPVDDPSAFLDFVRSRWPEVSATMQARRTQTNEPGRCATLLPVLAGLPQPLALIEVGASAGLCLYPDRYAYRYETPADEHRLGDGPVVLECTLTGPVPLPEQLPEVVWRAGIDLNPLDLTDADDRRWLASLIWPEQRDRAERLAPAMAVAAADPPRIVKGDLLEQLPALLADVPGDATPVVFHSAVLAYLPPDGRARFTELMGRLTDQGVHWVSNEAPGVIEATALDPTPRGRFVLAHDQRPLALAHPHGYSLDWLTS